MKEFHPPKWFMYLGICVFALMVAVFIVFSVIDFVEKTQNVFTKEQQKQAEQFKAKADSISHIVEISVDSLTAEKFRDSVAFVRQKESLKTVYSNKVKSYEVILSGIDTLDDVQLNSAFSVREMLSDSASKVW